MPAVLLTDDDHERRAVDAGGRQRGDRVAQAGRRVQEHERGRARADRHAGGHADDGALVEREHEPQVGREPGEQRDLGRAGVGEDRVEAAGAQDVERRVADGARGRAVGTPVRRRPIACRRGAARRPRRLAAHRAQATRSHIRRMARSRAFIEVFGRAAAPGALSRPRGALPGRAPRAAPRTNTGRRRRAPGESAAPRCETKRGDTRRARVANELVGPGRAGEVGAAVPVQHVGAGRSGDPVRAGRAVDGPGELRPAPGARRARRPRRARRGPMRGGGAGPSTAPGRAPGRRPDAPVIGAG